MKKNKKPVPASNTKPIASPSTKSVDAPNTQSVPVLNTTSVAAPNTKSVATSNIAHPQTFQTVAPIYVGWLPNTEQPLLHVWPSPVVIWPPTPAAAVQPSVLAEPEASSLRNNSETENTLDMVSSNPAAVGDATDAKWLPKIDMLFDNESEAYDFYNTYAEKIGFFVRRSTLWTTSKNIITRRTFVCSKEGFKEKRKGVKEAKCPRPETRIGCPACMTIRLTPNGKYRVSDFVPNHNHQLASMSTILTLKAKKLRCKNRAERADLVDDTVMTPEFETEEEAYEFYSMYAARVGFTVRRASLTVSAENVITRRMFVCSREGFREKRKGTHRVKKYRPETRTGCPACMIIKVTPNGKYHASEFVTYHNHQLAAPSSNDLIVPCEVGNDLDADADVADGSADGSSSNQVHNNLALLPLDNKNYLRSKRARTMAVGDAGAILEYLQKMQNDNPSFFYAIQVDEDDNMTNFFWSDSQSMMDFNYFGDVVCFDTIYNILGYGRPFALFTGVNHHKQTTIFGAALLYDENAESLKWLFETFKEAMGGKQPKALFTDRILAITNAIAAVWPGTTHRFCTWHIYQNALEHLSQAFHGSRTLAHDFSRCLFYCEDEEELLTSWKTMCDKYDLKDNAWLAKLFEEREKWALVYGQETFHADLKNVQQNENLSGEFKKYLSMDKELLNFFEHYERILGEKRHEELQADFLANQVNKKPPSIRMLRQAASAYTPAAYKMFEREFELYMDCMLYRCGQVGTISEYKVTTEDNPKEYVVKFNSSDDSMTCSCKKFEFTGIQCRHVLKVLDTRNVKELPEQYILKRWRKDAKSRSLTEHFTFSDDVEIQSSVANRYSFLCRIFKIAAARAAKSVDSYAYMERQSDVLINLMEQVMQTRPPEMPSLITGSCDRLENPVECVITENMQYEKANQASFPDSSSHGLAGAKHSHPAMCWGQFPAGPPDQ